MSPNEQRIALQKLANSWKRKSDKCIRDAGVEWQNGFRYLSRQIEGESISLLDCAADLEAFLKSTHP